MVVYTQPKEIRKGQILYTKVSVQDNFRTTMIMVQVFGLSSDKEVSEAEIMAVAGDSTMVWVPTKYLFEKTIV